MAKVFLNRRSGVDRRNHAVHKSEEHFNRRSLDRRMEDNEYVVVIGDSGMDRFTLLVTIPVLFICGVALIASA